MVPCAMVERGQNLHLGYDAKNKDKICYPSRAGIVIRSLTNPTDADIFTGFRGISNTTVAKFSPSGYYVCAGSKGGWVKVFGSKRNDEGDYIVKAEYEVLSGPPKDLAWDGESKRICVVGDGSETYTRAFIVDSGASTGELGGHSGRCLSVDYKPSRPFRVITGSEDAKTNFYAGPPFKFGHSTDCHTAYVTCVRYDHKGAFYCTVGSDKAGFIFEGKDGKQVGVLGPEGMHKGSVYSCSWSPDDSMILTTSADKTAKVWAVTEDRTNATLVKTFDFLDSKNLLNMVVGGMWTDSSIVLCTLNGDIIQVPSPSAGAEPEPEAEGAEGAGISSMPGHGSYVSGMSVNSANGQLICCDGSGRVLAWDAAAATAREVTGKNPKIFACSATSPSAPVAFCGTGDNKVVVCDLTANAFSAEVALAKVPRSIVALGDSTAFCVNSQELAVLGLAGDSLSVKASYPIDEATALAISPCGGFLVVGTKAGGAKGGGKLTVYPCSADAVAIGDGVELDSPHAADITAVAFSADGSTMAAADGRSAGGNISVWAMSGGTGTMQSEGWVYHQGAINDLAFSPDGKWLTTVSNDASVFLFGLSGGAQPSKKVQYQNLHEDGINTVVWLSDTMLVTGGKDGQLRTFTFIPG